MHIHTHVYMERERERLRVGYQKWRRKYLDILRIRYLETDQGKLVDEFDEGIKNRVKDDIQMFALSQIDGKSVDRDWNASGE